MQSPGLSEQTYSPPDPGAGPATRRRRLWPVLVAAVVLAVPLGAAGFHAYAVADRGPQIIAPAEPISGKLDELAPGLFHLRISGEGYTLGLRHGTLLRSEVQAMVSALQRDVVRSAAARDVLLVKAWQLDAHIDAAHRAELRGIADGAQVTYADVLLINTYDDLVHLVGCSSAVLLPEQGEPLRHARNLDYPIPELARHKVVFDLETRGVTLRTVGFPGYIGVLTGMSSRGLGLSSHTSTSGASRVGTPSGIVYRKMLEDGHSLDELQQILRQSARTIGNNLALSDARTGAAVAVELDAEQVATRAAEGGRLYVTNHFQIPEMQARQNPLAFAAGSGSVARVACLERSLPSGRPQPVKAVEAALSEGSAAGRGWRTPTNGGTVQSVILEPDSGRLRIARGSTIPVTRGGYLELPPLWQLVAKP